MKKIEQLSRGVYIFAILELIIGITIIYQSIDTLKEYFSSPEKGFIFFILIITFIGLLLIGSGLGFLLKLKLSRIIGIIACIFIIITTVSLASLNIISTARQYDDLPFRVSYKLLDYRALVLILCLNLFPIAGLVFLKKMKLEGLKKETKRVVRDIHE